MEDPTGFCSDFCVQREAFHARVLGILTGGLPHLICSARATGIGVLQNKDRLIWNAWIQSVLNIWTFQVFFFLEYLRISTPKFKFRNALKSKAILSSALRISNLKAFQIFHLRVCVCVKMYLYPYILHGGYKLLLANHSEIFRRVFLCAISPSNGPVHPHYNNDWVPLRLCKADHSWCREDTEHGQNPQQVLQPRRPS